MGEVAILLLMRIFGWSEFPPSRIFFVLLTRVARHLLAWVFRDARFTSTPNSFKLASLLDGEGAMFLKVASLAV